MSGRIERGKYYSQHEIDHRDIKEYVDDGIESIVIQGSGEFDVLDDYDSLRTYVGTASGVVVKNFTYTFNAISYTTIGGVFVRSATGTENGATLIIADNAIKWKRLWDEVHIIPEWWEVGGYSWNGTVYIDNTSETLGHPDGIFNERDRIESASRICQHGVIVLKEDKLYDGIDIFITHYGQKIEGNNAILKRCDAIIADLGVDAAITDTEITLDTIPTGMRVGQYVILLDGDGVNDHDTSLRITNIVGNVITLSSGITANWTVAGGGQVLVVPTLMSVGENPIFTSGKIERLTFDGNRDNNTDTQSWLVNSTYVGSAGVSTETSVIFDQCNFIETPCENVVTGLPKLINCTYLNLGGSFTHFNSSRSDFKDAYPTVSGCKGVSSNLNDMAKAGHSEALIVFSNNPCNIIIENNRFEDGGNLVLGGLNAIGGRLRMVNNTFSNFVNINYDTFEPSYDDTDLVDGDIHISGNEFITCGDMVFLASTVGTQDFREGFLRYRIHIEGNNFINSRLVFSGCARINISNNNILYEDGKLGFTGFTASPVTGDARYIGAITLGDFDEVKINGNSIVCPETSADHDWLRFGIHLMPTYRVAAFVNSGVATPTSYLYAQNVSISDNLIYNFRYGIHTRYESDQSESQTVGWKFNNNTIYSGLDLVTYTDGHCMEVPPGALAIGNQLYNVHTGASYCALRVLGVITDGAGNLTRLHGGNASNNWCYGEGISIVVGETAGGTASQYNAIVVGNYHQGAMDDSSGGNSYVNGNILIDNAILTSYTVPENPVIKAVLDNTGYY